MPMAVTVRVKAWVVVFGVGVGRRDGDRVAAGGAEGRRARQGAVAGQGDPRGQGPVSLKVIGVSPLAVTEKVPALFSANVVECAEVNTGGRGGHREGEGLGAWCSSWRRSP